MRTEDLLRFQAEIRAVRQALLAERIEVVFPSSGHLAGQAAQPAVPVSRAHREGPGGFVGRSQGAP